MRSACAPPRFSAEEGRALLAIARAAILETLGVLPASPAPASLLPPDPYPVFVTLFAAARLRGCIGLLHAEEPLARVVANCARAAAFEDPRFAPLDAAELPALAIEVSILGLRRALGDLASLRLGEEGLVVTSGRRSGLLLPRVATEQGWGALEFLEATCLKAGLPRDAWRAGALVEAFAAQVFSEPPERP